MERLQRMREVDDQDCASTISSSLLNEKNELSSQNSLQKTLESQASQELNSNDQAKESNEILQCEDLQKMILDYKQIGGELKSNLKLLETKWHSLNKELTQKSHECEMLHQQKDFQMKNLVDLQIKLENLDMERIELLKDCQQLKSQKTELFTNEMHLILENDEYVTNTYNKFNEIVLAEKQEFENLLVNSRTATEDQAKAGESYYKELQQIKSSYKNDFDKLFDQDSKLEEEIHQALEKCKLMKENNMRLKEKILLTNRELKATNEKQENLKLLLEQRKNLLYETEDNFSKVQSQYEEKLQNLESEIAEYSKEYEKITLEIKETMENIAQEKVIQENLGKEYEQLVDQVSKVEQDFAEKQQEIYLLKEEHHLISVKLSDAKREEALLKEQAAKLPAVTESLNNLKSKESSTQELIASLKAEIAASEEEFKTMHLKEETLKENEIEMNKIFEDWQQKLNESEKEFSDLLATVSKHCETTGSQLFEKYKELELIEKDIENIESDENGLDTLLKNTEKEIDDLHSVMNELLKEKEALNEEVNQLNSVEEEIEALNHKCEESEVIKSNIINEISAVTKYLEENPNIKDLEDQLTRIMFQINESTLRHNEQMDTLEMSHESQKKNLENKMSREIKEIDKNTGKLEARTKRMTDAVPELNQDISNLEEELKKLLMHLIDELQTGLNTLEEIALFYQKMQIEKKNKGVKANLLRNLTAIDEQLARPMKCMMALEGIPRVSLDHPTPNGYITVINAFKQKYLSVFQASENNAPVEMAVKLREIGSCMFGQKWVEPNYSELLNDTEISSSTTDIYF